MPTARERLRRIPASEMYGIRAPILPHCYRGRDHTHGPKTYGVNWAIVREGPAHIGYVRRVVEVIDDND